ncbi:hypothetical protein HYX07_00625 [Candidatus Woesearchaeota archaeon]|nr:hypothetical protein [Candidatus Woesearchaeota archaeon]
MHRKIPLDNPAIFEKICELSNISKFRIVELTQNKEINITLLAKKVNLAFNKCSNYCTELANLNIIMKEKRGKNVFIKSKVNLSKIDSVLS